MIHQRNNLSQQQVIENSGVIIQKLRNTAEYKESQNILFYVSYDNEVFTHSLIKDALEASDKTVLVPFTDKKNHRLSPMEINRWKDLKRGSYGILEPPSNNKTIDPAAIDIILVPGVAFDLEGNRIGHGAGYYDTLLGSSPSASHIGLAFDFQVVDKLPAEKHDVPVDKIITEKQIITP